MPAPAPAVATELLPVSGAARHGRKVVRQLCIAYGLPQLAAPASLVAGELISNVADHAHTMMRLELDLRDSYLEIRVHDGSTAPPSLLPEPTAAGQNRGWGLRLVEAFSSAWGHTAEEGGKAAWARLSLDG